MRNRIFGAEKLRPNVHRERTIPVIDGIADDVADQLYARILAKHVKAAKPGDPRLDEVANCSLVGHIDFDEMYRRPELRRDSASTLLSDVADDDAGSFGQECPNGLLADIVDSAG